MVTLIIRTRCKNKCPEYKIKPNTRIGSVYGQGFKSCSKCRMFLRYDKAFCPCCGHCLRTRPLNKNMRKYVPVPNAVKLHLPKEGYHKAYYELNKEKIQSKAREYYKLNREKIISRSIRYHRERYQKEKVFAFPTLQR